MQLTLNQLFFLHIHIYIYIHTRTGHKGALEPYDGKPIPFKVTKDQQEKLAKGDCVSYNERNGKSGRGVVIQDVAASPSITMEKIRDLKMYPKMVPHCRDVKIYETQKFLNGTSKTGAEFQVGVMGVKFGYYLMLTHEPKYNTLTWTLDYKYNSDFDDNCGHWQIMPHPSKAGWSRVLYSTKVKLFPWIPSFVVSFLTSKALTESTTWVKRESEAEAKTVAAKNTFKAPKLGDFKDLKMPKWMNVKGGASKNSNLHTPLRLALGLGFR